MEKGIGSPRDEDFPFRLDINSLKCLTSKDIRIKLEQSKKYWYICIIVTLISIHAEIGEL